MGLKIDIAGIALVLLLIAGAGVWYKAWVQPRDIFLHAIMDCMSEAGDMSRGAYNVCVNEVKGETANM